ncbi:RecQ family ATP-dependent DNA helicase [Nocardioides carbamazepini]|uniref:RecQ family ATP-dependent DNA helicase n=1 Tax=Nocardioides carbamazepini TaxID=2854259 RepID=UPI002149BE54|nr:RecQ family ATP-dependent DNA helicase [Nocardioides carbamazepini]MCR1785485.1 RecQ family ATP-dependent DNA helicase [Nocardioides carbamazepini]
MSAGGFAHRAQQVLRQALGGDAAFRPQQLEAIETIVARRGRLLVVQRTGWGKSAVYFVSTRLLRDEGAGPSIIISPLLALMRDQIEAAKRIGLVAETINSSNRDDWDRVEAGLLSGSIDLLLISPERLNNTEFRDRLLTPLASAAGLLVIDEAHCISDWGHDFRPDYRRIVRVLDLMPSTVPVLCTTATANDRVVTDIVGQLGTGLEVIRGSLDRESLSLHVRRLDTQPERLAWLAEWLPTTSGSGIIYCLTVADTRRVADWLNARGISAVAYSGDTDAEVRLDIERRLKSNDVKVVVATSALGMGYDKPDLAFVVHFQSPDSPVAYYQQVGRAGRAIDRATAVLLVGAEDSDIWEYFLANSLPVQWHAEAVTEFLASRADWTPQRDIESAVNIKTARLTGLLKILEIEGAVERSGTSYRRTLRLWEFDEERVDRVRDARVREQQTMKDYADSPDCRMAYIRSTLDDPSPPQCGRCDNCNGSVADGALPKERIVEAVEFIRRRPVEIDPRRRWVGGGRTGGVALDQRLQPGRALAYLSDPGWGRDLLQAKHAGRHVDDSMVEAAAALVEDWLENEPQLTVVFVPNSDPARSLVPDFARRLAATLKISISGCVEKVAPTQPQKLMENSVQQFMNVHGSYRVVGPTPTGPVLLVDDVSDSRWTMTVIGALLAEAGVGPVYPFAIAKTKG